MQDYFDFLIDQALDMRDFDWVKELQQKKDKYKSQTDKNTIRGNRNKYLYLGDVFEYNNETIVLEDMISEWGSLTDKGIININFQSKDNIIDANIVQCDKKYKKGEIAKYKIFDGYEQCYIKGFWLGNIDANYTNNSSELNYHKGLIDGYKVSHDLLKAFLENANNKNDSKKKWWQFWK